MRAYHYLGLILIMLFLSSCREIKTFDEYRINYEINNVSNFKLSIVQINSITNHLDTSQINNNQDLTLFIEYGEGNMLNYLESEHDLPITVLEIYNSNGDTLNFDPLSPDNWFYLYHNEFAADEVLTIREEDFE